MNIDFAALIPFAIITTFSPGPNNIIAATMGINHGYRKTFPFLMGIWVGFVLILTFCALLSNTLLHVVPQFERVLSIIGAMYILWLAYHTFRATYDVDKEQKKPLHFVNGFILQMLNPKVIIYGLTLYGTFLVDLPKTAIAFVGASIAFATLSFSSTTTWTCFGSAIARFMQQPKIARTINMVLAILLILIAVDMTGIVNIF
ncbi:MAG: lysine transporter LysE [Spirochaetae bacterium HGW-Spirochaetae-2]|jgi:cysteine/O-acetylserine efflux protein|nr:MAG: lysine transporter LysE [Spirochaetae bacterium HGW-Spirochaetae-2]